jgi:CheY-like chemotaxis protein
VYLPVDTSEGPVVAHAEPAAVQWSKGTETVLLVEDAPVIRRLAREIISRAGYMVMEAGDADEALSVVATHVGPLDILVTDLIMPGPSGIELAEQLKWIREDVRVLFMSGYTDNAIVRNGLLEEGAAFLQKPFTPEGLLRKMRQVLDAEPI